MQKILILTLLLLFHTLALAEQPVSTTPGTGAAESQPLASGEEVPPSIHTLLMEMNRNSTRANQLLEKISVDGCDRQLQVDTIGLVANMNRNIQIMTSIMVRMGYNIEELSRAPKKMNDLPFMP